MSQEMRQSIDWLNQILLGGDNDQVIMKGTVKPSISKSFAERFAAIQAMIEGRSAYETVADLPSPPPQGVVLAEVWNDPVLMNNTMYGWTGDQWSKTKTDLPARVNVIERDSAMTVKKTEQLSTHTNEQYAYSITDQDGNICLGVDFDGNVDIFSLRCSKIKDQLNIDGLVSFAQSNKYAYSVTDQNGDIALAVREDGTLLCISIESDIGLMIKDTVSFTRSLDSDVAAYYCDDDGNICGLIAADGVLHWTDIHVTSINGYSVEMLLNGGNVSHVHNFDYEINYFPCYGQSLSVGQALPIQTAHQTFDNVMFNLGMRPQYDYPSAPKSQWYQSFQPLIESEPPQGAQWIGVLGETPVGGQTDIVKTLIQHENGLTYTDHNYQLLGAAPGWGATSIAGLSKGTGHYARLVEQVQHGLLLSANENKTFAMPALSWVQGESDYLGKTTFDNYLLRLNTLFVDINADVTAITNQREPIKMICYQLASHMNAGVEYPCVALALTTAARLNENIYVACPTYHLPHQDGFHLTGHSSRVLGGYLGMVYKRTVIDRQDWQPLQPIDHVMQGNVLTVKFHVPKPPLVIDIQNVSLAENFGFCIKDKDGNELDIKTIMLSQSDTVKFILTKPIPNNCHLQYGFKGAGKSGPEYGPRGNLRDSAGDTFVFSNYPMHNWCVLFDYKVEM